jgi:hypothetical protein
MKEIINKLKNYKVLKAEIKAIEIDLQELNEDISVSPIAYEERTGETHKISNPTESAAFDLMEKKSILELDKRIKERQVQRIDNALSVLTEKERMILENIYIKGLKWDAVTFTLDRTYPQCKKIEYEAIRKISRFLM